MGSDDSDAALTSDNQEESDSSSNEAVLSETMTKTQLKKQKKKEKRNKHKEALEEQSTLDTFAEEIDEALVASKGKINYSILKLIVRIHGMICEFVNDSRLDGSKEYMKLPTIQSQKVRDIIEKIALKYHCTFKMRGKGKHRNPLLYKTISTGSSKIMSEAEFLVLVEQTTGVPVQKMMIAAANDSMKLQNGQVVGANAQPLNENNVGYRLLQKMGYQPDEEDSSASIVQAVYKKGKAGLK